MSVKIFDTHALTLMFCSTQRTEEEDRQWQLLSIIDLPPSIALVLPFALPSQRPLRRRSSSRLSPAITIVVIARGAVAIVAIIASRCTIVIIVIITQCTIAIIFKVVARRSIAIIVKVVARRAFLSPVAPIIVAPPPSSSSLPDAPSTLLSKLCQVIQVKLSRVIHQAIQVKLR
jgi:hypothetical protein